MIDDLLEKFGREKFGDKFVRGIVPDNQPFTIIEYIGPDGEIWHKAHPFFDLEQEYEKWKEITEIKKAVSEMLD